MTLPREVRAFGLVMKTCPCTHLQGLSTPEPDVTLVGSQPKASLAKEGKDSSIACFVATFTPILLLSIFLPRSFCDPESLSQ